MRFQECRETGRLRDDMTFRELRCLITCAEYRDVVSAAVSLSSSTSSVVRQIRALEEELGVTLVHMRARPLTLTLNGERLVQRARQILAEAQTSIEALRKTQNRLVGTIRVALSLSSGHRLISEVLKDFAALAPEVTLDIRDVAFPSQLPQIQRGELDVALFFPAWAAPGVCCETLLHEELTVILPKGHRLARRRELRLAELSKEEWLVFYKPNSGRIGTDFYKACAQAGFAPIVAAEIQSQLVRMAHVAKGDGITVLARSYDPGIRKGLVRVPLDPRDLSMPAAIMWRIHEKRETVRLLLESVRTTVNRIYGAAARPGLAEDFSTFFLPTKHDSPTSGDFGEHDASH